MNMSCLKHFSQWYGEPGLGSANLVSCRKLLEELHEEGIRKSGYNGCFPKTRFFADGKKLTSAVKANPKQAFLSIIAIKV